MTARLWGTDTAPVELKVMQAPSILLPIAKSFGPEPWAPIPSAHCDDCSVASPLLSAYLYQIYRDIPPGVAGTTPEVSGTTTRPVKFAPDVLALAFKELCRSVTRLIGMFEAVVRTAEPPEVMEGADTP